MHSKKLEKIEKANVGDGMGKEGDGPLESGLRVE